MYKPMKTKGFLPSAKLANVAGSFAVRGLVSDFVGRFL
jgi:hypothetical protein